MEVMNTRFCMGGISEVLKHSVSVMLRTAAAELPVMHSRVLGVTGTGLQGSKLD